MTGDEEPGGGVIGTMGGEVLGGDRVSSASVAVIRSLLRSEPDVALPHGRFDGEEGPTSAASSASSLAAVFLLRLPKGALR